MANSFVFHTEWLKKIQKFEPEIQLRLYEAIIAYVETDGASGIPFSETSGEGVTMDFIVDQIDEEKARYREKVEQTSLARAEAGAKGGRASGEARRLKQNEANEANEAKRSKTKQTKQTKHDYEYDYDSDSSTSSCSLTSESRAREEEQQQEKRKAVLQGENWYPAADFIPPSSLLDLKAYCEAEGITMENPSAFLRYYQAVGWRRGTQPIQDLKPVILDWVEKGRALKQKKQHPPNSFHNFPERDQNWDQIMAAVRRENETVPSDGWNLPKIG